MHARAVPVALDRLGVVLDVVAVALRQAVEEVASDPKFVAGLLGALGEDLEFPLAASDFLVDAFEVDASLKAEVGVFLNEGSAVGVLAAHGTVVEALRAGVATNGKPRGVASQRP